MGVGIWLIEFSVTIIELIIERSGQLEIFFDPLFIIEESFPVSSYCSFICKILL